jgi:hypothetical protein
MVPELGEMESSDDDETCMDKDLDDIEFSYNKSSEDSNDNKQTEEVRENKSG